MNIIEKYWPLFAILCEWYENGELNIFFPYPNIMRSTLHQHMREYYELLEARIFEFI